MRTLVTGSSGRLGRSVTASLVGEGHDVITVDVAPPPQAAVAPAACSEFHAADLTDPADAYGTIARFRPQAVVHLAAIAVPFSRPEHTIMQTNSTMAFNVCQASVDLGVEIVSVASSPTILGYGNPNGWSPKYLPLDEAHPVAPWHAYALTKLVAEATVATFVCQVEDRVRFSNVRPCYVIAPEEWDGGITQAGHTVRDRLEDERLGAASLFNYVDARDAGELFAAVLQRAHDIPNGETFFAGAADALARRPLAELLPKLNPTWQELAEALTGSQPAFSVAKAEELLGWRPRRSWCTELFETGDGDANAS